MRDARVTVERSIATCGISWLVHDVRSVAAVAFRKHETKGREGV